MEHPKVSVQELTSSLQILVARTIHTNQKLVDASLVRNGEKDLGSLVEEILKNQIVIMGACAALITNVINTKESLGET